MGDIAFLSWNKWDRLKTPKRTKSCWGWAFHDISTHEYFSVSVIYNRLLKIRKAVTVSPFECTAASIIRPTSSKNQTFPLFFPVKYVLFLLLISLIIFLSSTCKRSFIGNIV